MTLIAPFCTKLLPRQPETFTAPTIRLRMRPRLRPRPAGAIGAVYHDNDQCTLGNNIEVHNRVAYVSSTLGYRTRCQECATLDRAALRAQAIHNFRTFINRSRAARGLSPI